MDGTTLDLVPRSFAIVGSGDGMPHHEVRVEWRGGDSWAVVRGASVLSREGGFEYEPMPSSRTKAFLKQTRFASPEEALAEYRRQQREKEVE